MSLPFLSGKDGQLKHLEPVIGDIREAKEGSRWHTLLKSDCRTAREFRASWEGLQGNAQDCAAYLGEKLADPWQSLWRGRGKAGCTGPPRPW